MLDRYAVQQLARAQVTAREIAAQMGVSVRTIRRIVREVLEGEAPPDPSPRTVGRPRVTEAIRDRVQALVREDPCGRRAE